MPPKIQAHYLVATLAITIAFANAGPIDATISARQTSDATTLNIEAFEVYAYQGGFGGFETPLYTPPNARYLSFLGVGNKYADCDYYQPYPPVSVDCPGKPPVVGFTSRPCGPVDDEADGLYPLYNASWSITQYGKKYVIQYNILDTNSGETFVACDSFTKDQLSCDSDGYFYRDAATAGDGKNITAKVGNVCPKS